MTNREALDLYESVRYNLTHHRHKEAVDVAFAALVSQKWISVEDRLPEPDTDVLIWLGDMPGIAVGQLNFRGELSDFWTRHFNPTHWMPLPSAPEEEV